MRIVNTYRHSKVSINKYFYSLSFFSNFVNWNSYIEFFTSSNIFKC